MLEIPLHSPEQMRALRRLAAAKKEMHYPTAIRIRAIEHKNKPAVLNRDLAGLEIYSTYRCARDCDSDTVAVEVYRFVHYPVSVFFVTYNDSAVVDDEYLVRLLKSLTSSETEVQLKLKVPKDLYSAAEKIFYASDGLSCRKERSAERNGQEDGRFSEVVNVCEAGRHFAVVLFSSYDNAVLTRINVGDVERDLGKVKKTLKQYLPVVSKADRLTNEDEKSESGKPNKFLCMLGKKPNRASIQPLDRTQSVELPFEAQSQTMSLVSQDNRDDVVTLVDFGVDNGTRDTNVFTIDSASCVDYQLYNGEPHQEQSRNTTGQLYAAPKSRQKKSKLKDSKFFKLFKLFKPAVDKTKTHHQLYATPRPYSSCAPSEQMSTVSDAVHQQKVSDEEARRYAELINSPTVGSQMRFSEASDRSNRSVRSGATDKTLRYSVSSSRATSERATTAPSCERSVYDSEMDKSETDSLYGSKKFKFESAESAHMFQQSKPNFDEIEQLDYDSEDNFEIRPIVSPSLEVLSIAKREQEAYDELIEERTAKVNQAMQLAQNLRRTSYAAPAAATNGQYDNEPMDTTEPSVLSEIESAIIASQQRRAQSTKVEPEPKKCVPKSIFMPKTIAEPKARFVPLKPKLEPAKPSVEPSRPKFELPAKPAILEQKYRFEPKSAVQPKCVPRARFQSTYASKLASKPPIHIPEIESSGSICVREMIELMNEKLSQNRMKQVNNTLSKLNRGSVIDVQARRVQPVLNTSPHHQQNSFRHAASMDSGLHKVTPQPFAAEHHTGSGVTNCYRFTPPHNDRGRPPAQGEIDEDPFPTVKETCSMLERIGFMSNRRLRMS